MKKWMGIGAIVLIIILVVAGTITFSNKVEQSQKDVGEVERGIGKEGIAQEEEIEEKVEGKEEEVEENSKETNQKNAQNDDLSSDTNDEDDGAGGSVENGSDGETGSGDATSSQSEHSDVDETDGNSVSRSNTSHKSAAEIKAEYEAEFRAMEQEYQNELNALVQEAYDKYMAEGDIDGSTYKSRAENLESEADSSFYNSYDQLQKELRQNGHSPSRASEFAETYENKKANQRAELESMVEG